MRKTLALVLEAVLLAATMAIVTVLIVRAVRDGDREAGALGLWVILLSWWPVIRRHVSGEQVGHSEADARSSERPAFPRLERSPRGRALRLPR